MTAVGVKVLLYNWALPIPAAGRGWAQHYPRGVATERASHHRAL